MLTEIAVSALLFATPERPNARLDCTHLPPAQAPRVAGITRDFAFTPSAPGELALEVDVFATTGQLRGRITRVPIMVHAR